MAKYEIEIAITVETDATDLDDATDTAENFMAELHKFIKNNQHNFINQGWVSLVEVVDLEESEREIFTQEELDIINGDR